MPENIIPDVDFNHSFMVMDYICKSLKNGLEIEARVKPLPQDDVTKEMPTGAEILFSYKGSDYVLKVWYIFVDEEMDQIFHHAQLECDGRQIFDMNGNRAEIVQKVVESVK